MQNFKYKAIDLQKRKYSGVFQAENEKDLAAQLARQNLFLISCKVYSGKTPSSFFTLGTGQVSVTELTTFCRNFSIMISSGISITECFECMKSLGFSMYFRSLLQVIYQDVKSGMPLSKALSKHKNTFPEFFRSMVYVGESSGKLDLVFHALADYYDRDLQIRRKTKGALAYPIMLLCLTVAIVVLMLLFIIPSFKNTLADLNVTPEGFTKTVYDVSDFLTANWLNILAFLIVVALAIFGVSRTKSGALFFDQVKLKIPLVGKVYMALMCSSFARSFSLLLSSGMDMVESLESVAVVIENRELNRRFRAAVEEVKHGMPLVLAFEKHKMFPPMMNQMISVGERTASLDEILKRSCVFFDDQAETTLMGVISKIQPIMLMILGTVVAVLFLAVYSPIISIMTTIR